MILKCKFIFFKASFYTLCGQYIKCIILLVSKEGNDIKLKWLFLRSHNQRQSLYFLFCFHLGQALFSTGNRRVNRIDTLIPLSEASHSVVAWPCSKLHLTGFLDPIFPQFTPSLFLCWFLKSPIFSCLFVFVLKFIFNWRIIALQYCSGFCHVSAWMSHWYTYVPSHLPPHPTRETVTEPQVWAPCITQQISTGCLVLHMVMCMFQCYSLNSFHPLSPSLSPQVCSLCLRFPRWLRQ